jgi:hypothetical protein
MTPQEREQRREAQARYRATDKGKATAHRYWQSEKGRSLSARQRVAHWEEYRPQREAAGRKAREDNPERRKAIALVGFYVRTGRLPRPDACESCGRVVRLHGHHHRGYVGAAKLDVVWLCPACHRERHGEEVMPR